MDVRRDAGVDLAIVLGAIGAAWILSRWVVYPALGIPDYAPLMGRPIVGFLAAWWVLRRRGNSWAMLGLHTPSPIWRAIVLAVVLYLVDLALSGWAVPALAQWLHPTQRPSFLGHLRGNALALAAWLSVSWLVGGLCEECLFRGFLLSRVEALLGGAPGAVATAIVAQAIFFGSLHLYAGSFAFMYAAIFGVVHGVAYVAGGRNLWPLVVVHGLCDSAAMWRIYSS